MSENWDLTQKSHWARDKSKIRGEWKTLQIKASNCRWSWDINFIPTCTFRNALTLRKAVAEFKISMRLPSVTRLLEWYLPFVQHFWRTHVRNLVVLTILAACRYQLLLSVVREVNGFWSKHFLVSTKGKTILYTR